MLALLQKLKFDGSTIRFAMVGAFVFVVDIGSLDLISNFLVNNKYISVILAYIIGLIVNFYLSKYFTYKRKMGRSIHQFYFFLAVSIITLGLALGLVYIFINLVGLSVVMARILSILFTAPITYLLNRVLTFKKSAEKRN